MDLEKHPITILQPYFSHLLERYGQGIQCELSRYRYVPKSLLDHRDTFRIPMHDLTSEWLEIEIARLGSDEEIAFHSRVFLEDGSEMHLPVFDFLAPNPVPLWQEHMKALTDFPVKRILFFQSGRSMHGYAPDLLVSQNELLDIWGVMIATFYGFDLGFDYESYLDYRWMGHRLQGGYGSLRWTCQTQQYLQYPEFYGVFKA